MRRPDYWQRTSRGLFEPEESQRQRPRPSWTKVRRTVIGPARPAFDLHRL